MAADYLLLDDKILCILSIYNPLRQNINRYQQFLNQIYSSKLYACYFSASWKNVFYFTAIWNQVNLLLMEQIDINVWTSSFKD